MSTPPVSTKRPILRARVRTGVTSDYGQSTRMQMSGNAINYAISIVRNATHLMQSTAQLTTLLVLSNLWRAR
jgi:hypothetical protein